MRLAILAFGTRGDITPFVALGIRLKSEGHDVCLITHREFETAAVQHGLGFRQVAGSFQDFIATPEGRRALGVPRSSPLGLVGLFNPFLDCAESVYRDAWHATEHAEGIISSAVASPAATLIAARRHLPLAVGFAIPSVPTRAMPHPAFPAWPLGGLYNKQNNPATAKQWFEKAIEADPAHAGAAFANLGAILYQQGKQTGVISVNNNLPYSPETLNTTGNGK